MFYIGLDIGGFMSLSFGLNVVSFFVFIVNLFIYGMVGGGVELWLGVNINLMF